MRLGIALLSVVALAALVLHFDRGDAPFNFLAGYAPLGEGEAANWCYVLEADYAEFEEAADEELRNLGYVPEFPTTSNPKRYVQLQAPDPVGYSDRYGPWVDILKDGRYTLDGMGKPTYDSSRPGKGWITVMVFAEPQEKVSLFEIWFGQHKIE